MVQVTAKPVNFTEEGKILIDAIEALSSYIHEAIIDIQKCVSALQSCNSGTNNIYVEMARWAVEDAVRGANDNINEALAIIESLEHDGLLRSDLDVVKDLTNRLNRAEEITRKAINDVVRVFSGNAAGIKNTLLSNLIIAKGELYNAASDVHKLAGLYRIDPPEGVMLDSVKVVGIGIVVLLVGAGILKFFDRR